MLDQTFRMREDMTKEEQIEIMKDNMLAFMKNEMLEVLSDQETANALHYLEKKLENAFAQLKK